MISLQDIAASQENHAFHLLAVIYQDVQIGGFHRQSARVLSIFMIT